MSFFSHRPGEAVAIRFLRDYAEFGSKAHLMTSRSLQKTIESSSDPDEQRLLAVKNFSEMMGCIEDLAGLCIAIKHRDGGLGLVYGFLTYNSREKASPKTRVQQFYESISSGSNPIIEMKLPGIQDIREADLKLNPSFVQQMREEIEKNGKPEDVAKVSSLSLMEDFYGELPRVFQAAANTYLVEQGTLRKAYNQTKHGFKVVKDPYVFGMKDRLSETECLILTKNPEFNPEEDTGQPILEFSQASIHDVAQIFQNTYLLTSAIKTICLLVAALLEARIITTSDQP